MPSEGPADGRPDGTLASPPDGDADAPPLGIVPEGRLHPLSWLFVLVHQLRQVALPLILVVVVGRGDWWEVAGVAGAVVLALYSLVYSLSFRYRLGATALVVREGILSRTERHIPYARIQNVVQRRNPLHRLFGVTELRLESAGGSKPEAVMNVITAAEAARIEGLLRGAAPTDFRGVALAAGGTLLSLPTRELVRLGLVTNRGLVAVGAVFAFGMQLGLWDNPLPGAPTDAELAQAEAALGAGGPAGLAVYAVLGAIAFLIVLKLLSVAVALVSFHGFRLQRIGERIATERGLLTRHSASARRDKVQRLLLGESWLARRLHRRWLWCDVAAGTPGAGEAQEGRRLRWLAPIAAPERLQEVVSEVVPGLELDSLPWTPLHRFAWRRRFWRRAVLAIAVCCLAAALAGPMALLLLVVLLPLSLAGSRGWARFAAYACDGRHFAFRSGWLDRQWVVARIDKGQALRLLSSPFDRRRGMACVELDSAGASPTRLRVPYLGELEARELAARLRSSLD
jgi:putative membrane protein